MTEEEQYRQYIASFNQPTAQAPTDEHAEYQQYLKETGQAPQEPGLWDATKTVAGAAASGVGRGLNWMGGMTRYGLAGAADDLRRTGQNLFGDGVPKDQPRLGTDEDLNKALKGEGPSMMEYLQRAGVPEGRQFDLMSYEGNIPFTNWAPGKGKTSTRDLAGFVGDTVTDPLTYLGAGAAKYANAASRGEQVSVLGRAVQAADKVANAPANAIAGMGKFAYKSGLKRIDSVAAAFGKEPVSDLLMKHGIAGTNDQIMKRMNDLGDNLLAERNAIEQAAADAGAETSMKRAMSPVRAHADRMKADRNPQLQGLAGTLDGQAATYEALDRQYAQTPIKRVDARTETIDLPMQGGEFNPVEFRKGQAVEAALPHESPSYFDLNQGENVGAYGTPVASYKEADQFVRTGPRQFEARSTGPMQIYEPSRMERAGVSTMEVPGVNPVQSSGYKTTLGSGLPDTAFKDQGFVNEVNKATKIAAGGMKEATEEAIGRGLGDASQARYKQANSELGQLLTTQDKQAIEVAKAANKDYFTSIDGAILATSPLALASKKTADLFKTTWFRTRVGKLAKDFGENEAVRMVMRDLELKSATAPEKFSPSQPETKSQYQQMKPGY